MCILFKPEEEHKEEEEEEEEEEEVVVEQLRRVVHEDGRRVPMHASRCQRCIITWVRAKRNIQNGQIDYQYLYFSLFIRPQLEDSTRRIHEASWRPGPRRPLQ